MKDFIRFKFTKMSGAGNDFIVIDSREVVHDYDWATIAPKICDRRNGIGADGVIIIGKSSIADFKMDYFNADGSYGGMCGNGGRCVSFYVSQTDQKPFLRFESLGHVYDSVVSDELNVSLKMKEPKDIQLNMLIDLYQYNVTAHYIDTGSPHAVIFTDNLHDELKSEIDKQGILKYGRYIRQHPSFSPSGTNVNFIRLIDNRTITMRTYERGVENETLACGTGAVASSLISNINHGILSPVRVITHGNEILSVCFVKRGDRFTDISLSGNAKYIYQGEFGPTAGMPNNKSYVK